VDLARELVAHPRLAERFSRVSRASSDLLGSRGAELGRAILEQVNTYHHPVGTCRMGRDDDPYAVVDAAGAVRGVSGRSVIDAGIMPSIPSANTNLPTLMLAEHLSRVG